LRRWFDDEVVEVVEHVGQSSDAAVLLFILGFSGLAFTTAG
jgi:hypothetical protein